MDYYAKYKKYKEKYMALHKYNPNNPNNQYGGFDCDNNIVFKNILGTCWMVAIQTMFCFSDLTSRHIEEKIGTTFIKSARPIEKHLQTNILKKYLESIQNNENIRDFYESYLPTLMHSEEQKLFLIKILDKFIERYISKYFTIHRSTKPIDINYIDNKYRCEFMINDNFNGLFEHTMNKRIKLDMNLHNCYFFANLLSTYLLNYKISFKNYYPNYVDKFENIQFNIKNDIGILIIIGMTSRDVNDHVCCFFICDGKPKYYNDNDKKIFDCNWPDFLEQMTNDKCLYVQKKGCILLLTHQEYLQNNNRINLIKINILTVISRHHKDSILDIDLYNYYKYNFDDITDRFLLYRTTYTSIIKKSEKNKFIKKAAILGDISSMRDLVDIYRSKGDYINAINYGVKGESFGDFWAVHGLAITYLDRYEKERQIPFFINKSATKYLQMIKYRIMDNVDLINTLEGIIMKYIEKINHDVIYDLACVFMDGISVEKNSEKAVKYFEIAGKKGSDKALYDLGIIYELGTEVPVVPIDIKKALNYYSQSALLGNADALIEVSRIKKETLS